LLLRAGAACFAAAGRAEALRLMAASVFEESTDCAVAGVSTAVTARANTAKLFACGVII